MKNRIDYNDFKKLGEEDKSKILLEQYKNLSEITGISLCKTADESYGIVIDRLSNLFGKIGVFEMGDYPEVYFRFRGKRDLEGFDLTKNQIYWSKHPALLFDVEKKLFDFKI